VKRAPALLTDCAVELGVAAGGACSVLGEHYTRNCDSGRPRDFDGAFRQVWRFSLHDGPGIRTTVFLSGYKAAIRKRGSSSIYRARL